MRFSDFVTDEIEEPSPLGGSSQSGMTFRDFVTDDVEDIPSASGVMEGIQGIGQGLKAALPFSTAISPVELAPAPDAPLSGVADTVQSLSRNAIPTVGGAIAGGVAGAGTGGVTVPVIGAIPGAVVGAAGGAAAGGAISEGMEIQREERIRQLREAQAGDSYATDEGIGAFQPDALKSGAAAVRIGGRGIVDAVTVGAGTAASRAGYGILKELAVTAPLDLAGGGAQAAATIIEQGMRDGQTLEEIVNREDFTRSLIMAGAGEAALGSVMSAAPVVARKLREADVFGMASRNAPDAPESRFDPEPDPIPASDPETSAAGQESPYFSAVQPDRAALDAETAGIDAQAVSPNEPTPRPAEAIFEPLPGQIRGADAEIRGAEGQLVRNADEFSTEQFENFEELPPDIKGTVSQEPPADAIVNAPDNMADVPRETVGEGDLEFVEGVGMVRRGEPVERFQAGTATVEPAPEPLPPTREAYQAGTATVEPRPADPVESFQAGAATVEPQPGPVREPSPVQNITPRIEPEGRTNAPAPQSIPESTPPVRAAEGLSPGGRTTRAQGASRTIGGALKTMGFGTRKGERIRLTAGLRTELADVIDAAPEYFDKGTYGKTNLGDVDFENLRAVSGLDLPLESDVPELVEALRAAAREGGLRVGTRGDFDNINVGDADDAMSGLAEARDTGRALPVADFNELMGRARGIGDPDDPKFQAQKVLDPSVLPDGQEVEIGRARFKVEQVGGGDVRLVPQGGDASLFPTVQVKPDDELIIDRIPKGFKPQSQRAVQLRGDISRLDLAQIAKKAESSADLGDVDRAVDAINNASMQAVRDEFEDLIDPTRPEAKKWAKAVQSEEAMRAARDAMDIAQEIMGSRVLLSMEQSAGMMIAIGRAKMEYRMFAARLKNKGLSEGARLDAAAKQDAALRRMQILSDAFDKNGTDVARGLGARALAVAMNDVGEFEASALAITAKHKLKLGPGDALPKRVKDTLDRMVDEVERMEERNAELLVALDEAKAEAALKESALNARQPHGGLDGKPGGGKKTGKKAPKEVMKSVDAEIERLSRLITQEGCKLFLDGDALN